MSLHAWVTLAVLALTVYVLARDLMAPSIVMLGASVTLMLIGVINPAEAFSGFSNSAPITVAALYVIARAVEKTGGLQPIVSATLGKGTGMRRSLARLLFPAASVSAFLNNTPIVSMLITPVSEWAEHNGKSPSRYLMPLSFAVILGGVVTAIGTSTNLVVSGMLEQRGLAPLGLFELTPIGLPVMIVGVTIMVFLAPVVLPARRAPRELLESGVREFAVHMHVTPRGPLDGKAVEAGGLRHLQGVYLVQIEREGEVIAPVDPTTIVHGDDRLTFVGRANLIRDLQATRGLESSERQHIEAFDTERHTFFVVVIGAASALVGNTLKSANFRSRYDAAVVAIHRSGHRVEEKLGEVELRVA
jgi:di/tricarboxylate transporter